MKFPGKRTNIELEEVLYLIEWGIYKRFEFVGNLREEVERVYRKVKVLSTVDMEIK